MTIVFVIMAAYVVGLYSVSAYLRSDHKRRMDDDFLDEAVTRPIPRETMQEMADRERDLWRGDRIDPS